MKAVPFLRMPLAMVLTVCTGCAVVQRATNGAPAASASAHKSKLGSTLP